MWLRASEPCLSQAARADAAALLRAALGAHGKAVSWFDASEARCGRLSHNLPEKPRRCLRQNLFCLRNSLVVARSRPRFRGASDAARACRGAGGGAHIPLTWREVLLQSVAAFAYLCARSGPADAQRALVLAQAGWPRLAPLAAAVVAAADAGAIAAAAGLLGRLHNPDLVEMLLARAAVQAAERGSGAGEDPVREALLRRMAMLGGDPDTPVHGVVAAVLAETE